MISAFIYLLLLSFFPFATATLLLLCRLARRTIYAQENVVFDPEFPSVLACNQALAFAAGKAFVVKFLIPDLNETTGRNFLATKRTNQGVAVVFIGWSG